MSILSTPRMGAALLALTLALPLVATAGVVGGSTAGACQIVQNLTKIVGFFGTIILAVAVLVLLWAGFLFMTGGGNEEKLKTAKQYLMFALIGLAVAVTATQADNIVSALVGGDFLNQCNLTL